MDDTSIQAKEIFLAALERGEPTARAAYLDGACRADAVLRERVEALLRAHDESQNPLERPAVELGPTELHSPDLEQPGMLIGPYKLMEKIGEGGFGLVFVADQQQPVRRRVALKVIKPGMDTREVIARFEAERQALALMDHPHIARVLDAGATATGRPYFVMELVRGVPITEYCDQHQLTPRERLELFVTVCQAVQHAHQKGIIHRDIKPSNVLVTLQDGKPFSKVIDFGVAKAVNQQLTERTIYTRFAQLIGTPLYMSPEQAQMSALDIDTRSDIYSLGVLLYELLTGATPFDRQRLSQAAFDEVRRIIREEEPPKPSQRLSRSETLPSVAAQRRMEPARLSRLVRGELDWIVMKALEKDRNRRYETAAGFARDVEHYLHGEPVEASPPSATYRLKKIVRKHGFALGTAVTFAAVLLAATAVSTWQAIRAGRAEQSALAEKSNAEKARAAAEEDRKIADKARAAEATLRQAAEINTVRIQVERYAEDAFNGSVGYPGGGDWDPSQAAPILKLARLLREIPEFAYVWREAATLCILGYGQHITPLLPEPTFGGLELRNTQLSGDGRFLVGTSSDGRIQVYWSADFKHLRTLALVGQPVHHLNVHGACMVSAMPRDRLQLFICSLDDPTSAGALIRSDRPIHDVLLSADGRRCVTQEMVVEVTSTGQIKYQDRRARIWDIVDNSQAVHRGELHGDAVPVDHQKIKLSPDGKWLVTQLADEVMIFATDDARHVRTIDVCHDPSNQESPFDTFMFSPSGNYFAAAQVDHVSWWRTDTWEMIEPVCRSPGGEIRYSISILSDDFLSGHDSGYARLICVRRGEALAQQFDVWGLQAAVDDLLLMPAGDVWRWGSSKPLPKPPGRKFAPEAAKFAFAGRYLDISLGLVDLETGVVVCQGAEGLGSIAFVAKDGLAWLTGDFGWAHFPQQPGKLDPRTVELWLQVILRGELNDADEFAGWNEATWESHREELSQRQVRLGKFSFPGVMADDRLYWLRKEADLAVKAATDGLDAERRALELADRLMREEPTWRSHDLRATLFAELHRYADSVREQLEVGRITDWYRGSLESRQSRFDLVQQKDRPAAEYELLLQWLDESQRADAEVVIIRSLALYRLGRHREAIEFLNGIETSIPREAAAQNAVRALCLLARGETKAAQNAFRTALPNFDRANPNFLFGGGLWRLDLTDDLLPMLPLLTGEGAKKQP